MSSPARPHQLNAGRASLEFLVAAVVLFIPLLVFGVAIQQVTQSQLATEAAARHAARVFVQHTSLEQSVTATHQAMRHALSQYGLESRSTLDIHCRPRGSCLEPNSWVDIRVSTRVPVVRIPLLPHALPATVMISADASAQVSHYRGER